MAFKTAKNEDEENILEKRKSDSKLV